MSTVGERTPSRTPVASSSSSSALVPFADKPRSLNRQVVLEEDEYTKALEHIIARDFFPSLNQLDATNSYLTALESGDQAEITESVRRLDALTDPTPRRPHQTPGSTPYANFPTDTPVSSTSRSVKRKTTHEDVYGEMGLDGFQAKFTSEDNASFVDILEQENRKRKEKWGWAWKAEEREKQKRIEAGETRRLFIRAAGDVEREDQKLITQGDGMQVDATEEEKQETRDEEDDEASVLAMVLPSNPATPALPPESEPWDSTNILSRPRDLRPTGVPQWGFKNRNSLMFAPDADVSPHAPLPLTSAMADSGVAGMEPKAIRHVATRMPVSEEEEERQGRAMEPPSPSRSRVGAAIAGTPYRPSDEGPTVSSYPLVDPLPSPSPSELGPDRLKQLMTWGTITGTPRALGGGDDDAPPSGESPFRLAPPTPRDNIARRLAGGASKSLREKAAMFNSTYTRTPGTARTPGTRGSMPPPSSSHMATPRREDNLSPAGRALLSKAGAKPSSLGSALGTAGARRAEVMSRGAGWAGGALGSRERAGLERRWTPSPSPMRRPEEE